jgi:hypothetical protein
MLCALPVVYFICEQSSATAALHTGRYSNFYYTLRQKQKGNPWHVVRKRTMPTERPSLVGEVSANFLRIAGAAWSAQRNSTVVNLGFLDRSRYFLKIAPQLSHASTFCNLYNDLRTALCFQPRWGEDSYATLSLGPRILILHCQFVY